MSKDLFWGIISATSANVSGIKTKFGKKFEHNRDIYTDAKTDFINHYTFRS